MTNVDTQIISYDEENLGTALLDLQKGSRLEVELFDPNENTDDEMLEVPEGIRLKVNEIVERLYSDFDHVVLARFSFSSIMFYKW
jgi:hypothetical protein